MDAREPEVERESCPENSDAANCNSATRKTGSFPTSRLPPPPLTILHAEDESVEVNMAQDPSAVEVFFQMLKDKERELMYQKRQLESCREEVDVLKQRLAAETDPIEREKVMKICEKIAIAFVGKKVVFMEQYEQWRGEMVKIDQELRRHGIPVKIPIKYRDQEEDNSEEEEPGENSEEDSEESETYSEESTEDASVE